jgi:hypothetical protein
MTSYYSLPLFVCYPPHWSLTNGFARALALTSAGRAIFARLLYGEGKLELTESAREFQKVSAPQQELRALEERMGQALPHPAYFFCGSNIFSPFLNTP